MFGIKKYLIGLCIGLVLGLWMGTNIGKKQPVWSNPLSESSLTDDAKAKGKDMIKDVKKAVREQLKE